MSKIGIQLFGLGKELGEDLEGTLQKLKDIGYEAVELAVLFGANIPKVREAVKEVEKRFGIPLPASVWNPSQALKNMDILSKKSLAVSSCHIFCVAAYEGMLIDVLPEVIEFSKITGIKNYVVSYMLEDYLGCEKFSKDINKAIDILSPYGITVCYHNHETECRNLEENKIVLDYLLEQCDKKLKLQVDIGWADFGGLSVTDLMEKNKDRIVSVHLKDFMADACEENKHNSFTAIGEGRVPTFQALKIARDYPIFQYGIIIDQDESKVGMISDLQVGYKNIAKMLNDIKTVQG
jgi:sugar phosphate isomerase/epimerase